MIVSTEICLLVSFLTVMSVFALRCPENQACSCQRNRNDNSIEITCFTNNYASFFVKIQPNEESIRIECINSPEWSDFNLGSVVEMEQVKWVQFQTCDLPSNTSLGKITQMLGANDVETLTFRSYKNLSFTLEKRHLDGFKDLKNLILSSNNVSYVHEDLLTGLANLTGLNLRENNLHLSDGFFNYTPGLQWLELGDNDLGSIKEGTFHYLRNLTYLNLWKNHLTKLQPGIFDNLVSLHILDLNTNSLTSLDEDIFAKMGKIKTINLSRNNFTHLPANLLRNNTQLQTFNLFDNKRNMTLPSGLFANLTELKVLNLKKIGLFELPEELFWGCSSLTNVSLDRNYLTTLPAHLFRDSKQLIELELDFNKLERLPDNIFANASRLKRLDLSKNRFTSISSNMFNGLVALEELNMQENQLVSISDQSFVSMKRSLKIVRLSKNHLTLQTTHGLEYRDEYGAKSPFAECESLEELYLANNNISEIFSDWVVSNPNLRQLDLKYNNISLITSADLQFLSSNIRVDLTYNKIRRISLHDAEELAANQEYSRNVIILVDNNPINCDCDLYDFLRYIEGEMHPKVQEYFHIIPRNLTCQGPPWLKNMRVTDLRSRTLTCKIDEGPNIACPENCDCFFRPVDQTFIFDFTHRELTQVPSDIKKPGYPWNLELNFNGNRLRRMPDLKRLGLERVKKLGLSHNNISEIFLDALSSTIEVLELHNNNMSRIHSDVLEFLKTCTNLTRLTLHDNPWECDCAAKDFLGYIQTKYMTIPDLFKVTCRGENNSISKMTPSDFCPFDTAAVIGISVAIALMGLFVGTSGLLYYKYQRQIKVWLFAHQWCLWFVTEEELDKEKLYDAFVSYSHKDHDFVVDELVSKLEGGPAPFKLCLHYRDWQAGEWIPANIARSVEDSRRTIVVLSPNFLESVWGRMEFRAAHSQALSEGRARVILILYGDVGPTDDLDPELKAYLSMNTYVKWGDPWFWDKLRYALPHRSKFTRKTSGAVGRKIFENHQLFIQANGDKKELIYPVGLSETPPATTTPPADSLNKTFIRDKKLDEQLPANGYSRKSCNLNGDVAIIFKPEQLDVIRNDVECTA
ncbi:hypothetical protein DMN91_009805 [Ooceraea biroi]|uniref:Protein toll n=1 Tax=Ooceraea biroi TaxID=2015173 RepID=A0A026W7S0_OOCBI|nr:protein toll [Ooceraea biroi]EZA52048.1 Protein toll [Ooceraea biroi]RLU17569.1 hypothetical protein DMN91_009805 [Ooceraea biroi]